MSTASLRPNATHHLRGKCIEEDYSNMDNDTNITSINSHPQYITLQIIDNELIYNISDGTQSQFWICNDEATTQSTPAYSIQLSIFIVIGILATLCCCLMLLLYAISMKPMKSNTPAVNHQQHIHITLTKFGLIRPPSLLQCKLELIDMVHELDG